MYKNLRDKCLASEYLFKQILGSLLEHRILLWVFLLIIILPFALFLIYDVTPIIWNSWYQLAFLTCIAMISISSSCTLTDVFSLRKKETAITWCQFSILITIGIWIIGFVIIFQMKSKPGYAAALGIIGTIFAWIFQETIKGVAAFIHLRLNNQLCIGDWIQVPKNKVDGIVTRVSLTNVTIYNWDTTTATIPTSMLHSDYFINLQQMREGKTYGRRMCKTFIIDTGWIYSMSGEEANELKQMEEVTRYIPEEEIKEGMINAYLFRLYLFHWLMNHPHISQQPRLVVRWMEQTESGMPLQVYAFITDTVLPAFEWQQSQIIEHIIESLDWFGLRLYQSPSSYDVSNSNIHITEKAATYRKEAGL